MSRSQKKALAKSLYLQRSPNLSLEEIAKEVGLNVNTLKHWVFRGSQSEVPWKKLRDTDFENKLTILLESNETDLHNIYQLGLAVVQRSLASMELEKTVLSEKGVDRLLTALDKIDKWMRLEEAKEEIGIDDDFELGPSEDDIMRSMFKKDDQ